LRLSWRPRDFNVCLSLTPKFLFNLPYISEFISQDVAIFASLFEQLHYLNETIPVSLPELALVSKLYDASLPIEDETRFDLIAALNKTKQDEMSFESLSHCIYNTLLESHTFNRKFDMFSALDWVLVLACIAGFLALILVTIMHFKMRTLFLLSSSTSRAKANVLPTHIAYGASTTAEAKFHPIFNIFPYDQVLKRVVPIEHTMLICFLLLVVLTIVYVIVKNKKKSEVRTVFVFEIGNNTKLRMYCGTVEICT